MIGGITPEGQAQAANMAEYKENQANQENQERILKHLTVILMRSILLT